MWWCGRAARVGWRCGAVLAPSSGSLEARASRSDSQPPRLPHAAPDAVRGLGDARSRTGLGHGRALILAPWGGATLRLGHGGLDPRAHHLRDLALGRTGRSLSLGGRSRHHRTGMDGPCGTGTAGP